MKAKKALFIVLILMTAIVISAVSLRSEGEKTTHFYNNSGTTVQGGNIKLTDGGGADTSYYFRVGKNVPISHAYFNISTRNTDNGMAIQDPYIDLGVDGEAEWEFTGNGYGKFGEQQYFNDNKEKKSISDQISGRSVWSCMN